MHASKRIVAYGFTLIRRLFWQKKPDDNSVPFLQAGKLEKIIEIFFGKLSWKFSREFNLYYDFRGQTGLLGKTIEKRPDRVGRQA